MNDNKILIVDIETTGFLMQGGSIVEIGIAELDLETGKAKLIYDSLVREPIFNKRHKHHPFGWIFMNSNLEFEDVLDAPLSKDVFPEVQTILNQYPLGATAFNKAFDFDFLRHRGLIIKSLPCPMLLSTNICKLPGKGRGYKWPKVEEAYDHFFPNNDYIELHRGADDALHEAEIVYELYKMDIFKI